MSTINRLLRPDLVDARGPRFAAWVTTAVLTSALLIAASRPAAAAIIPGLQAVVFTAGALGGPRRHPYGRVFATLPAPRLGPVADGAFVAGVVATAAVLPAAFRNAAFGICLGCRVYPVVARFRSGSRRPVDAPARPRS